MTRRRAFAEVLVPTEADYRADSGGHCATLWAARDSWWEYPGCERTKFQLLEFKAGIPRKNRDWRRDGISGCAAILPGSFRAIVLGLWLLTR